MSRGNDDYETKPIVPWTWSDVDKTAGKILIRYPFLLVAVLALITGTVYTFPAIPALFMVNAGGGLGQAGRSMIQNAKPGLDGLEQGAQTFGKPDDALQQKKRDGQ